MPPDRFLVDPELDRRGDQHQNNCDYSDRPKRYRLGTRAPTSRAQRWRALQDRATPSATRLRRGTRTARRQRRRGSGGTAQRAAPLPQPDRERRLPATRRPGPPPRRAADAGRRDPPKRLLRPGCRRPSGRSRARRKCPGGVQSGVWRCRRFPPGQPAPATARGRSRSTRSACSGDQCGGSRTPIVPRRRGPRT